MARLLRSMFPRRRRRQPARRLTYKFDTVSIAGVTCRRVAFDKDGYVFQSIAEPALYFAVTHKEYDELRVQIVPAKKD
ncbi:hypothetical protein QIH85_25710 [Bradyrhizobium japonicum]|uniref:hypothetical protein n=1 Tax=Bradyrhizobium japonicum TaxID=375 RepID=UPI0027151F79|nr:hypothetical protein [Bradyrhizobium japonicum]WLB25260.1 hypothetical protein QIH85_25710 [Bradyrhizobium japonicum]